MASVIAVCLPLMLVALVGGDQTYNFIVHQAPCAINQTNQGGGKGAAVVVPIPPADQKPVIPNDALGKRNEADIDGLRSQLDRVAKEVSALKLRLSLRGGDAAEHVDGLKLPGTYVYFGCPREININIVNFVTTSLRPKIVGFMKLNETAKPMTHRILLEPTLPPFPVFCTINKYIVIQRRSTPFTVLFNRTWNDYKTGFGDVSGDFWLGLDKVHAITAQSYTRYSLRMEAKLSTGAIYYVETDDFHIGDESQQYKVLSIGRVLSKTTSNMLRKDQVFATKDKDQKFKCGSRYNGFWYYARPGTSYTSCSLMTFNSNTPYWNSKSHIIVHTEMKIRPVDA